MESGWEVGVGRGKMIYETIILEISRPLLQAT